MTTPCDLLGREDDGASNLYYYRARYYSPQLGRFISQDPLGLSAGMNVYAYADGNPVSESDPRGLMGWGGGGSVGHPSQTPNGCGACEGNDRWTVTINGGCADGDMQCALAFQAAGFQGQFFSHTRTYSKSCLIAFGMLGKPVETAASTVLIQKGAPWAATKFGASEGAAAAFGRTVSSVFGWEFTLAVLPYTVQTVADTCECRQ